MKTQVVLAARAVREKNWKLILGQGSGLSTQQGGREGPYLRFSQAGMVNSDFTAEGMLKPDATPGQLYDLAADPGETMNLYAKHPEIVRQLTTLFERIKQDKRTRP